MNNKKTTAEAQNESSLNCWCGHPMRPAYRGHPSGYWHTEQQYAFSANHRAAPYEISPHPEEWNRLEQLALLLEEESRLSKSPDEGAARQYRVESRPTVILRLIAAAKAALVAMKDGE